MAEACKNCLQPDCETLRTHDCIIPDHGHGQARMYLPQDVYGPCLARTLARALAAESTIAQVRELVSENGCDCACDHGPYGEHDDRCVLCLACRMAGILGR